MTLEVGIMVASSLHGGVGGSQNYVYPGAA
jgi:hypothetical protein